MPQASRLEEESEKELQVWAKCLSSGLPRVCAGVLVLACFFATAHLAYAKPLDKPACEALKLEHQTLLESGIKDDIARGPIWANLNLGQLRLQQIGRLFEVEEQIAFRCKGVALTTAVVIPSLRSVKPLKKKALALKSAKELRRQGIKRSRIPEPVRRPSLAPVQSPQSKTATVQPPSQQGPPSQRRPATTNKSKAAAGKSDEAVPQAGPAQAKLPNVIRLQKSKASAAKKARQAKARRAKARQIRARRARQRRKRSDTYVPPPVSPGYQPSLSSP